MSTWMDGTVIEGEVGFSSGRMAKPGTKVVVMDKNKTPLGETQVGENGLFRFQSVSPGLHILEADLGAGHIARGEITVEMPQSAVETSKPEKTQSQAPSLKEAPAVMTPSPELETMIAQAVRAEVQPLRKEIARYKEKNDLQAILGGLGYILGLCGLAAFFLSRKKVKGS